MFNILQISRLFQSPAVSTVAMAINTHWDGASSGKRIQKLKTFGTRGRAVSPRCAVDIHTVRVSTKTGSTWASVCLIPYKLRRASERRPRGRGEFWGVLVGPLVPKTGALIPEDSDPGRVICQSGEVLQFLNTCGLRGRLSITKGGDPDTTAYMP